jgi:C-terminal processing protease CtpA/Prc
MKGHFIFFFNDKKVYQRATIKSNTDEKVYILTNDATTASASGTLTIAFTVNYDKDAGANLIGAKFQGKALDIGIEY